MKFRKALSLILAFILIFTLTSCQKKGEEVKVLTEEYEIIVELGFVPFKFENATPIKYETIGSTTSRITATFEDVTYVFVQTKDRTKDLSEGIGEMSVNGMLYIDGRPAMIGYNEGADAFAIWTDGTYNYSIYCEEGFNYESFVRLVSGSESENKIEDTGLTAEFEVDGFDMPSGYVNIMSIAEGEALIESCACYIISNPGDATVLKLTAAVNESAVSASVDGMIFAGEFDEENSAFILGEQIGELVDTAAIDGDKYVYEIANPYPDEAERVAFAIGADIIAGTDFYTGEMAVVVLEP